jgi:hypothetical protein
MSNPWPADRLLASQEDSAPWMQVVNKHRHLKDQENKEQNLHVLMEQFNRLLKSNA